MATKNVPLLSIIIPVYNGGQLFQHCLQSIAQNPFQAYQLIVVDDGSTDESAKLAARFGAQVLHTTHARSGPAVARNLGAQVAQGTYLFFVDADCELREDTLTEIASHLEAYPHLDALFGSYDDQPGASNFIAQYKNLFHHYVHQGGQQQASTFWTGCGVINRQQFLRLGGFDTQTYRRPSIEDIDLGYRLKQAGGEIHLVKGVQVKHHKAWRFGSLLKSDIFDRGIPWTRLILQAQTLTNDLNLQTHNRISVVAIYSLLLALGVGFFQPIGWGIALFLASLLLWLNYNLYHFFYRKRGLIFSLKVIPLHWLYYGYNAIAFGCGFLLHLRDQSKATSRVLPEPLKGVEPDSL